MDGTPQQPPKSAIEILIQQADGRQILNEQTSPIGSDTEDINDPANRQNLQKALAELSEFSDSYDSEEGRDESPSPDKESSEDDNWQAFVDGARQCIEDSKQIHNFVNNNHEDRERKIQKSTQVVIGILTVMKQKNLELEKAFNNQLTDTTSNLLAMNQQQAQQQKALINDLKIEQQAIKKEFKAQYDECYSNECNTVAQLNQLNGKASEILALIQQRIKKQESQINDLKLEQQAVKDEFQASVKAEFKEEITQLKSYVKLLSFSLASTICGILMWIYIHTK